GVPQGAELFYYSHSLQFMREEPERPPHAEYLICGCYDSFLLIQSSSDHKEAHYTTSTGPMKTSSCFGFLRGEVIIDN
ncbi:hypothetical protein Zmor_004534, partial [Zophobas morio]